MKYSKANKMIIIANNVLREYTLDNKKKWEAGRPSGQNRPDITLKSPTASRKQGRFENINGLWFYMDYNSKNGTIYNHEYIKTGIGGRIKPKLLEDGDVFVFGSGKEEHISNETIWGLYTTRDYHDVWRAVDTAECSQFKFFIGDDMTVMDNPGKGMVLAGEDGMIIYMGDYVYLTGNADVEGY